MSERIFKWTDEQNHAMDFNGASVCVSAAAGSGKTTLLAERIARRVKSGAIKNINEILVVTYTKKAAAELRARISKVLNKKFIEDKNNKRLLEQIALLPCTQISTIDSFYLELVTDYYQELNLSPDFKIDKEKVEKLEKEAMREVIDKYYSSQIESKYEIKNFKRLVRTFSDIIHEDGLINSFIKIYEFLTDDIYGIDAIDKYIKDYELMINDSFDNSKIGKVFIDYIDSIINYNENVLNDALKYIDTTTLVDSKGNNPFGNVRVKFENALAFIEEYKKCDKSSYKSLSDFFENNSVVSSNGKLSSSSFKTTEYLFYDGARTNFVKSDGDISKIKSILNVKTISFEDSVKETIDILYDLKKFLTVFEKTFRNKKSIHGVISFKDLGLYSLELLWDKVKDAPTEIANGYREFFSEVYIDEFQDTSEIQNKIFDLISKSDRRFYVGDVKQSIYSFRGARPKIFNKLLCESGKHPNVKNDKTKVFLSENHRSCSEVLDFSNSIFRILLNQADKLYSKEDELICHNKQSYQPVELHLIGKNSEDESKEATFVASKINDLIKNEKVSPSDIAILLRQNKPFPEYANALKSFGIESTVLFDERYYTNPEIITIVSILTLIDNKYDDKNLASILVSSLFNFTPSEIFEINRREGAFLYDKLEKYVEEKNFEKGKRFLRIHKNLESRSLLYTPDRLVWYIFNSLGLDSIRYNIEDENIESTKYRLQQFEEISKNFADKSLHEFVAYLKDEAKKDKSSQDEMEEVEGINAVKIMTIHKSKGLEFEYVFVSKLDSQFHMYDKKPMFHMADRDFGLSFNLPDETNKFLHKSIIRNALDLEHDKNYREEEARILYVAFTRAKKKLFITSSFNFKKKDITNASEFINKILKPKAFGKKFYSLATFVSEKSPYSMVLNASSKDTNYFKIHIHDQNIEDFSNKNVAIEEKAEEKTFVFSPKEIEEITSHATKEYPYLRDVVIPRKIATTKLTPDILESRLDQIKNGATFDDIFDAKLNAGYRREITNTVPSFISETGEEERTASQVGTATHIFMQFFNDDNVQKYGVKWELDRMVREEYIYKVDRDLIDEGKLEEFFKSDVYKLMKNCKRLVREKRFNVYFDAYLFTQDKKVKAKYKEEKTQVLIQGAIDCIVLTSDTEGILIDYKTDSFPKEMSEKEVINILTDRHHRQLEYYKYAAERLYNIKITKCLVYSFALGHGVEIKMNQIEEI